MARRVTPSASRPSSRCSASSRSSRAPGGSCVAARPPAKRSGSCCVARTTCSGYGGTPPSSNQPGRPPPERPPGELPRTTTAAIGQPAEPSPEAPERPGRSMTWRRVLCATAWYQPESTVAQSGGPAVGAERVRPLPVAAVHDVVERAPVGPLDRRERTVGGDAEGDQQGAEPVLGKAQEAPRELLVVDAGMSAADAEVGGGQHDAHRRLAQVELDQVAHLRVVGAWGHERGPDRPHLWARGHVALLEVTLPLFKPWAGVEPERRTRREVPRPHKPLVALLVPPLSNTLYSVKADGHARRSSSSCRADATAPPAAAGTSHEYTLRVCSRV